MYKGTKIPSCFFRIPFSETEKKKDVKAEIQQLALKLTDILPWIVIPLNLQHLDVLTQVLPHVD